jgi:RHS repeat-associated protein
MTQRNADGKSYTFAYDAENRLVSVSGDSIATFTYNGDGQRVKSVMDGETILFVGGHYEIANPGAGQIITKYYTAGGTRVALRKGGTLSYVLADHLGSTSLVTDASGNHTSELRYKPWGETRFSFGTMPTKYTFTGQFSYTDDPSTPETEGFGLMYYGGRWVDVSLGRFTQPDSLIPDESYPQSWDRYAYVGNNPVKNTDPDGHCWPLCTMAIGALVGAAVSAVAYVAVATVTHQEITTGGVIGAAVGGAIAGAVSGLAGPIAGTLMASVGIQVTATSLAVGAAVVNGAAGALANVAATATTNAIDVPQGKQPIPITPEGVITSAVAAGGLSMLAGAARPVTSGQYSLSQASYFAPGRTWGTLIATQNARNVYGQIIIANGAGSAAGTALTPYLQPQPNYECVEEDLACEMR